MPMLAALLVIGGVAPAEPASLYNYSLNSNQASLSFSAQTGSPTPAAQALTIWDTSPCPPPIGVPTCHWATTLSVDQTWLAVTPTSGTTALNAAVSVNTTGMAVGTYSGNVIATAAQLAGSPIYIPVTLTITGGAVAPTITAQPPSLTVTAGQTATFSVTASGTAPLSYQWKKNGTAVSGAISATYTTPATVSSNNGSQFTVVVSNSAGSVTSAAATLTVNAAAVAPSITSQPTSQTVTTGQTATFSVTASGTAPLSYQWKKNGTAVSGATSSVYTTPATIITDNASQFTVVVSNSAGSVTSATATLTVNAAIVAPSIISQPTSQTVAAGQSATFSVAASGTAPLSYQWKKNGAAISGATSSVYTTPATIITDNGSQFTVVASNSAGSATSTAATLTVNAVVVAPSITAQPTSQAVTVGQTATFSVTASGTAPLTYQWKKNGAAISGAISATYTTPATIITDNGSQFTVVVSNSAGSATSSAATLTVNQPTASVTFVQVASANCYGGSPCTTSAFGRNTTPGNTIVACILWTSGTTGNSLNLVSGQGTYIVSAASKHTASGPQEAEMGMQCATTTNITGGSTTPVSLTLASRPVGDIAIAYEVTPTASNPVDQTAGATGSGTAVSAGTVTTNVNGEFALALMIVDDGIGIGSYFGSAGPGWTAGFSAGGGITEAGTEFQTQSAAGSLTGNSTVNFTGSWVASIITLAPSGNSSSGVAPSITSQPTSQTVTAGQGATFSVAASGTAPLTYQWKKNGTTISGAASATYTTPATVSSDNGSQFTVVISNSIGSATSAAATLTVNAAAVAPSITSQPTSQTVTTGQTATFSATASGTAPLTYQWKKNGAAISGATSSAYTTPATASSDNGSQFTVVISNSIGSATSGVATLTVSAVTSTLATSPTSLSFGSVNIGSTPVLSSTLTNSGTTSITISNVSISGAGLTATGVSGGLILAPGQAAILSVTFAPASTGSVTGTATVTSNASNSPTMIALSGTGVAVVSHSVTLSWSASTSSVIGYNAYRATTSGGPYTKMTTTPVATMAYTDNSVQAGQTYYYVVTAVNSSNVESGYSNQITATVP